jgi:hypothetical protein
MRVLEFLSELEWVWLSARVSEFVLRQELVPVQV